MGNSDLLSQQWPGKMIHITVSDEDGKPLEGASIIAKGDMVKTMTDRDGIFSQKVHELVPTLIISYSGYQTQQIDISQQSEWEITLIKRGCWYHLGHPRRWRIWNFAKRD